MNNADIKTSSVKHILWKKIRKEDIFNQAVLRLQNYDNMNTIKIDVSDITPEQAAYSIFSYLYPKDDGIKL